MVEAFPIFNDRQRLPFFICVHDDIDTATFFLAGSSCVVDAWGLPHRTSMR